VRRVLWPAFNSEMARNLSRRGEYYDQVLCHNACLMRHRHVARWLLFADPDEFLHFSERSEYAKTPGAARSFVERYAEDGTTSEITLKTQVFGQPMVDGTGLVIERYTRRKAQEEVVGRQKYIARSSGVAVVWTHHVATFVCGGKRTADPSRQARLNHYYHVVATEQLDGARHETSIEVLRNSVVQDDSAKWAAQKVRLHR